MFKEFKEFAMRGNVIDMAVGIIIGAAFGKIITSLVNDILMPPLGLIIGNVNFPDLFFNLSRQHYETLSGAKSAGAATINYGLFVNTIIDFILVAFALFLMIRQFNRLQKKPAKVEIPASKECPYCYSSIPIKASKCAHCTSELKTT